MDKPTFKIEIDAEAVQRQVIDAIMHSAIGAALKTQLTQLAERWQVDSYWNNTLQKIIENEVNAMIRQRILDAAKPYLDKLVPKLVTEDAVSQIVLKGFERARIEVKSY